MSNRLLVIAVLVAAAVGLYLVLGGGDDGEGGRRGGASGQEAGDTAAGEGAGGGAESGAGGAAGAAGGDDRPRPELPEVPAGGGGGEEDLGPVRDHRGERGTRLERTYKVKPDVIRAARAVLRARMKECQEQFKHEISGQARLQARVGVLVQGGVLTIEDVAIQTSNLPEGSEIVECARAAFASAEVPAEGHAEVEHTLNFPFDLPLR
ncbi:MAG TPA: hypothetical protein VKZ63_01085 [Kofleriaceae bacterium]|nr:hypothetical protein [Kofleriaceae bacterium]